jgi:hypothetical protein
METWQTKKRALAWMQKSWPRWQKNIQKVRSALKPYRHHKTHDLQGLRRYDDNDDISATFSIDLFKIIFRLFKF